MLSLPRRAVQREMKRLAGSVLFQAEDYAERAGVPAEDALAHFCDGGWRAGIDPSPFFSVQHYLSTNPDVAAGGLNPLFHYLETGWAEGRSGHPDFNAEGYRRAHPEAAGTDLLSDCVRRHWSLSWPGADDQATLLGGSVLFQPEDYAARAGVERASALQHFSQQGWRARIDPSPFFDVEHYLTTNPDVAEADVNPLAHYVRTGWAEGRWGHPTFHPGKYLAAHPDAAGRDPLADCVRRYWTLAWPGSVEEAPPDPIEVVRASPYLDADFYLAANADVAAAELDPAAHYVVSGAQEFRNPSAGFDTWFYVRSNPDLAPAGAGALIHYTEVGQAEGRLPRPPGSVVLEPHPDPGRLGEDFPLRVAMHVHLSRPELMHEVVAALRSIPVAYAVFCSVYAEADRVFALRYFARTAPGVRCEVRVVARGAGGALGSLLDAFRDVWDGFDLVCHLHTAPNPEVGDAQLRPLQLNALLGGPELAGATLQRLLDEPDLGFFFPENPHLIKPFVSWGDLDGLAWLQRRLGLEPAPLPAVPDYPAGSMGWFRPAALAGISGALDAGAFQADAGLANGLEKLLPTLVRSAGLRAVVYYAAEPQTLALPEPDHVGFGQGDVPATRWRKSMPALAAERPVPLAPGSRVFNPEALALHWVLPNLTRGSGGHMSVLRIVKLLASFGHRQTIWIRDVEPGLTPAAAKARMREWYQPIGDDVHVRLLPDDMNAVSGDAIIATHCSTVFPALATAAVKERFYFIQDYEPLFSPMGDEHLAAEATYRMGLAGLCAGPWLLGKAQAHGMWARAWDLAPDREFYFPPPAPRAPRTRPRVAFYCRSHTPRRAAHLGFAAFQALRDRGVEFDLVLFGEEAQPRPLDFPFEDAGLLTPEELGDLYRDCDLGVVFSTTNYSLVPLEIMACGLPVLELDSASTRAVFGSGEAALAPPDPNALANVIAELLADGEARREQAERGRAGVAELAWETSARAVERAIRERLAELGHGEVRPAEVCARARVQESRAAVVIPTYNGGELFKRVLERAAGQATGFDYEVLVVDSSSADGTAEFAREFGGRVRLHKISKADFQHGRTRNLAISMTRADHIALLTQDALPADDGWLAKLVGGFGLGEKVGGVVGSHRAYPEHDAFAARDIAAHFNRLHDYGEVLSLERGLPSFIYPGGHQWQDALQFYSDNNSCLLRAAWEILPYPEIEWGEDQLWAWRLLQLGFEKAYVHEAAVFHSHVYAPAQEAEVAEAAGWFWKRWFGRDSYGSDPAAEAAVLRTGEEDLRYAIAQGVPRTDLEARGRRTRAGVFGRLNGSRRGARPDPGT